MPHLSDCSLHTIVDLISVIASTLGETFLQRFNGRRQNKDADRIGVGRSNFSGPLPIYIQNHCLLCCQSSVHTTPGCPIVMVKHPRVLKKFPAFDHLFKNNWTDKEIINTVYFSSTRTTGRVGYGNHNMWAVIRNGLGQASLAAP